MTISEKLKTISNSLKDIKEAIINKGAKITGDITTYADIINGISTTHNYELSVVPQMTDQIFTAPEGCGYSPVNIKAVTSSIDANIKPENIKKGVTILGVTGTYEANELKVEDCITSDGTTITLSQEYAKSIATNKSLITSDVKIESGIGMYGYTYPSYNTDFYELSDYGSGFLIYYYNSMFSTTMYFAHAENCDCDILTLSPHMYGYKETDLQWDLQPCANNFKALFTFDNDGQNISNIRFC